jgi:hypothetical protein
MPNISYFHVGIVVPDLSAAIAASLTFWASGSPNPPLFIFPDLRTRIRTQVSSWRHSR